MLASKQKLERTGGVGDKCSVAAVEGKQVLRSAGDFLERGEKKKSGATGQGRRCQEVFSLCGQNRGSQDPVLKRAHHWD